MPVFHLDIESFMTTIARHADVQLRRRPLVVAPKAARSTVIGASPDAKKMGVRKGMAVDYLKKRYPGIQVIYPDYQLYDRASRAVMQIVGAYSPTVELMAYGHVAMDMSGMQRLFSSLETAALKMAKELQKRLALKSTIGIASNKLVSLIAAKEIQKQKEVLYQVPSGNEPRFLAPLSCKALPEWRDPNARRLLFELNLHLIQLIQNIPRDLFSFAVGKLGNRIHRHAFGIDLTPVYGEHMRGRLSAEHTFHPDTNDDEVLLATLFHLLESQCTRLRSEKNCTNQVRLTLRYSDDVMRTKILATPLTQDEQVLARTLRPKFIRLCDRRRRIRYLRIDLGGVRPYYRQLSLFEDTVDNQLAPHLDAIRKRFGEQAVYTGRRAHSVTLQPAG